MRLFILVFLLLQSITQIAQTTSNTVNPDWESSGDWTGTRPRHNMTQSAILDHNSSVTTTINVNNPRTLTINSGDTLFTTQHINIANGGTMNINGHLEGTNGSRSITLDEDDAVLTIGSTGSMIWAGDIEVGEDATMTFNGPANIGGDVEFMAGSSITINASIVISGDLDLIEDGVISGTGGIIVLGDFDNSDGTVFGCTSGGDNCCTSGTCTLGTFGIALPIELLVFEVKEIENNLAAFHWETASETNNDYFVVQESIDGQSWINLGTLPGAGNSLSKIEYDQTLEIPSFKQQYFRLLQVDYDGQTSYSNVVTMCRPSAISEPLSVWPNPTSTKTIQVQVSNQNNSNSNVRILDSQGRLIYSGKVQSDSGIFEYRFQDAGVYHLELEENGNSRHEKVFVL